jgi:hypothetical protein
MPRLFRPTTVIFLMMLVAGAAMSFLIIAVGLQDHSASSLGGDGPSWFDAVVLRKIGTGLALLLLTVVFALLLDRRGVKILALLGYGMSFVAVGVAFSTALPSFVRSDVEALSTRAYDAVLVAISLSVSVVVWLMARQGTTKRI